MAFFRESRRSLLHAQDDGIENIVAGYVSRSPEMPGLQ
jgi:hypothetical protein